MPEAFSKQDIRWFSQWTLDKGLFSDVHRVDVPPDGFAEVNNFIYRDGFLRCRPGTSKILNPYPAGTEAVAHLGFFPRLTAGTSIHIMSTISGTAPYGLKVYAGYPWGAPYSLAAAVNSNRQMASTVFKDEFFLAPGDESLLLIDGVAAVGPLDPRQSNALLKVPGAPRYIASNDSRVFLANTLNAPAASATARVPYRLHWCDFLNVNVWNGGIDGGSSRYVDLAGEPDPITGLWSSGDVVVAFKRRAIYTGQFVGPPRIYDISRTSRGVGCISHQTIREWKNGILVWLGDDNIYMGAPGQKPEPVAGNIQARIDELAVLNRGNLRMSRAVIDRTHDLYHLFIAGSAQNKFDKILTLNLNTGAWWEGTFPNGTSIFCATESNIQDYDAVGSNDFWKSNLWLGTEDHRVLDFDWAWTNDDGTAITCTARTGIWNYAKMTNRETMEVQPQAVRVMGAETSGAVTLTVSPFDSYNRPAASSPASFTGVQTLDGSSKFYVEGRCQGESFDVQISGPATTSLTGLGVGYIPKGDLHRKK
jgi:hypothetical protein